MPGKKIGPAEPAADGAEAGLGDAGRGGRAGSGAQPLGLDDPFAVADAAEAEASPGVDTSADAALCSAPVVVARPASGGITLVIRINPHVGSLHPGFGAGAGLGGAGLTGAGAGDFSIAAASIYGERPV